MLSACFVLPLEKSIPDFMHTANRIALVRRVEGVQGGCCRKNTALRAQGAASHRMR